MKKAPIPKNESERIDSVKSMNILDTQQEERFDNITKKAVEDLEVLISTISIIDSEREWFKSCQGLDFKEAPREMSFCGHALIAEKTVLIVEDALKDEKFSDNPQVINPPHIRFYAGVKLFNRKDRMPVGVFCVKDTKPRTPSIEEIGKILDLAQLAEEELNKK
jgi:GAF domain-containing protein